MNSRRAFYTGFHVSSLYALGSPLLQETIRLLPKRFPCPPVFSLVFYQLFLNRSGSRKTPGAVPVPGVFLSFMPYTGARLMALRLLRYQQASANMASSKKPIK